jgi:hypothetical protein
MTEDLAFRIFVTLFMGGLAAFTLGMVAVGIVLLRRHRRDRSAGHSSQSSDRTHALRR